MFCRTTQSFTTSQLRPRGFLFVPWGYEGYAFSSGVYWAEAGIDAKRLALQEIARQAQRLSRCDGVLQIARHPIRDAHLLLCVPRTKIISTPLYVSTLNFITSLVTHYERDLPLVFADRVTA